MREVWNSAWAPDVGSLALGEKKVFCDYLAAAGSHTQKAGFTMALISPQSNTQHCSPLRLHQALAFGARHT